VADGETQALAFALIASVKGKTQSQFATTAGISEKIVAQAIAAPNGLYFI
jgi:hypothetical protein